LRARLTRALSSWKAHSNLCKKTRIVSQKRRANQLITHIHIWKDWILSTRRSRVTHNLAATVHRQKILGKAYKNWKRKRGERGVLRVRASRLIRRFFRAWKTRGRIIRQDATAKFAWKWRVVRTSWNAWRLVFARAEAGRFLLLTRKARPVLRLWVAKARPALSAIRKARNGNLASYRSRLLRGHLKAWRLRLRRKYNFILSCQEVGKKVDRMSQSSRRWIRWAVRECTPSRRARVMFLALRRAVRESKEDRRRIQIAKIHHRRRLVEAGVRHWSNWTMHRRNCKIQARHAVKIWALNSAKSMVVRWAMLGRQSGQRKRIGQEIQRRQKQRLLGRTFAIWTDRKASRDARRILLAKADQKFTVKLLRGALNLWRLQLAVRLRYRPIIEGIREIRDQGIKRDALRVWSELLGRKLERRSVLREAMQEAKANIMRDAFKSWAVIARSQRKFQDTQWRTRSRRNVRLREELERLSSGRVLPL